MAHPRHVWDHAGFFAGDGQMERDIDMAGHSVRLIRLKRLNAIKQE